LGRSRHEPGVVAGPRRCAPRDAAAHGPAVRPARPTRPPATPPATASDMQRSR